MESKTTTNVNLNLDDNWEPNEDAYQSWLAKFTELGKEVEGIDSIINSLYDDISMWKERKSELLEEKSNLKVEDFI